MVIELTLPYPPTSNHNTMVAGGRRISSPGYRQWTKAAVSKVCAALGRPVTMRVRNGKTEPDPEAAEVKGGYRVTYTVDRPDRRKRDVENLPKSLSDALQAAGVIADDCHCLDSRALWSRREPGAGAAVHVRIEAV